MRSIENDITHSSSIRDLLDEFAMQIMHETIRFDANGFFGINMKLVTAVSYVYNYF